MLYEISEKVFRLEQEGKKVIKFNVGDPDQETDGRIIEACYEAMKAGETKYGAAVGEKKLREKLAEEHNVKLENIFITPGSKWSVFTAMHTILKRGDNIILPSPHWTAYELIAKDIGAESKIIKTKMENDWQIDIKDIENAIDQNTKMIVLSNPSNPTSKIVNEKNFEAIIRLSKEQKITILSDECYADISFEKTGSVTDFGLENICVKSFSKTFAMTGWRIGYMVATKELVEKFTKLGQITISNVPIFIQEAAVKALELKKEISTEIRSIYKRRAETAMKILSKTSLKMSKPDAPFYLFPYCASNSEKLAFDLLDRNIAITPGSAFGDYKEFFRLALTLPDEKMTTGLNTLAGIFS